MHQRPHSHARNFFKLTAISNFCLFLAVMSGALIRISDRMRLLPSYIFFFSFAAFSVMFFQTILTQQESSLRELDLREQNGILLACLMVSTLCVVSELTLVPWLKIPAGILLGLAVLFHGYRIWQGFTLKRIWHSLPYRFFFTDMLFLLVAAVGLFALGWKETWPHFPLIPSFLRPSTVFLGASFPLTLTFTGYLVQHALANGGISPTQNRIFEGWYYLLVGGVLSFLILILLDLRTLMLIAALLLALGVFVICLLFIPRLARHLDSLGLLFAFLGLVGLLAASTAGTCLIISNTPTIPAGGNPLLLSHVHMAQLIWVCISFWGIQYTLWPMMLDLDRDQPTWLPLAANYPPLGRVLALSQLVLAIAGLALKVASHMRYDHSLMVTSGLIYAIATLIPLPVMALLRGK